MIASGIGPLADTPSTTCVATHTAIATTMVWTRNPPLFVSPAIVTLRRCQAARARSQA